MNWEWLLEEADLASALPGVYAHYRRPLHAALAVFLEGLPAARQEAIAIEQATLPETATASERLALLARSCPVLHKLGQTLARDRNLSSESRRRLQQLESLPPSVTYEAVERVLAQELGPLDRLGVRLAPTALAEASVAVVIPFHPIGGKGSPGGVFKVLKPGIEERLEEELNLLERVASFLDERRRDFQIPHLDYRDSFEQVRDKLRYEIRLDREQRNLSLARDFYRGDPRVRIPALLELCTPRVTAMERVTGQKATERRPDSWSENRQSAGLVIEALIARPIFSRTAQALFHGDPHAGNLFFTKERRLAILDWSLVGSLGERQRASIMQILLGAMTFRTERIAAILAELSVERSHDLPALGSVADKWIGQIRQGHLPGFTWLIGMLDEAVRNAGLRLGGDMMLLRRALHMVEGVAADIGGESGLVDRVLLNAFVLHFFAEWPWRFLTPPDSRAFATQLSNADLAGLMWSLPWSALQGWLDQNRGPWFRPAAV